MTRDTMASAIRMGVRRSSGKEPEAITESVLLAIEMAMELEETMKGNGLPGLRVPGPPKNPELDSSPPPPNPDAIEEPVTIAAHSVPVRPPLAYPAVADRYTPMEVVVPPAPQVQPPGSSGLVILATDADIQKAASNASKPKVRRLFMRSGGTKIKLEDVTGWIVKNFPATMTIIPKGVTQEVVLSRKVYVIPCSGEGRRNEKESVAKIAYNHPKMDSTMEVGLGIRVGDVDEKGYPVVADMMAQLQDQARELYKARPPMIEGRIPTGPSLENAFRAVTAPRATPPAMKFADADQPLMFPDQTTPLPTK